MTLVSMGWSAQRQKEFSPYACSGLLPGRVVGEHRTHYRVVTDAAELTAIVAGRVRNSAAQRSDLPGVGDFVATRLTKGDGPSTIEVVLPRVSALVRKASGERRPQLLAANIDAAFIVTAMDGDFNLLRMERYLTLVDESGAVPVIVLNKADLASDVIGAIDQLLTTAPGVAVFAISARDGDGIFALEQYFEGNKTVGLIGSSGVGKSTLTNQLLAREAQLTQSVRTHDNRGRHTTTQRHLFARAQGGAIIDTPGMRQLEVWNAPTDAESNFDDIVALATQCRFRNCRHESEPACAVSAAIGLGKLDASHLASYLKVASARHHR